MAFTDTDYSINDKHNTLQADYSVYKTETLQTQTIAFTTDRNTLQAQTIAFITDRNTLQTQTIAFITDKNTLQTQSIAFITYRKHYRHRL